VVLTPSPKDGWPAFKLNATNPGQYFYNAIVMGDPNTTLPVTVNLAYPFVTQGATPVHVYDAMDLEFDADGCFLPPEALQSIQDHQVAIEDYIGGTMDAALTCDQVGCGFDGEGTCSFEVAVEIPASGEAYMNVHMDYGLKGKSVDANDGTFVNAFETVCDEAGDRYDVGTIDSVFGGWDADVNTVDQSGPVALSNCKTYGFSHDDGDFVFEDSVQSLNVFKGIRGAYGTVAASANGQGVDGATVQIYRNSTDEIVATGTTDGEGYYSIDYTHHGKSDIYTVILVGQNAQMISLKSKGWAEVNFDVTTGATEAIWTGKDKKGGRRW
jgi:hypothetical protein